MDNHCALYLRISEDTKDPEKERGLGVARQEDDCRALAARLGLAVTAVYQDNDVGASTRSRSKRRPEYEALLEAVRAGEVTTIVAYSASRLTRRPLEFEELIRLHEAHGLQIRTVASGNHDLSTADGRATARTIATWDTAEAERTAERVARKHRELAMSGKAVGGRRPFGFAADRITHHPTEAELIRQAAEDVLNGTGVSAIAARWNAAGVKTTAGNDWTPGTMLQFLRQPRLAGWRTYRPGGTQWSALPAVATTDDGARVRGEWEPIISDETHQRLITLLTSDPERRRRVPHRNARRYLTTGLLRCQECHSLMYGNAQGNTHYYRCGCGNSASGRGTDAFVREVVVNYADLIAEVSTDGSPPDRAAAVAAQGRVDELGARLAETMEAYRAGRLTGAVAFPLAEQLEAGRARALAERDRLEAALVAATDAATTVDADTWDGLPTDAQRAIAERLLSAVYVRRAASPTGNRFDPARLDPVWR